MLLSSRSTKSVAAKRDNPERLLVSCSPQREHRCCLDEQHRRKFLAKAVTFKIPSPHSKAAPRAKRLIYCRDSQCPGCGAGAVSAHCDWPVEMKNVVIYSRTQRCEISSHFNIQRVCSQLYCQVEPKLPPSRPTPLPAAKAADLWLSQLCRVESREPYAH